ncbi:MAG: single-stranded DNA-binding protein [Clostridiales Family XIII bacterium]|jgi:single-strand DNA-binding protein|nr:single-stranded DNA-binding protein [Clostridiales Family XIII bacterium]
MNLVILTGNLARDPEVRYSQNQLAIARFTIAVKDTFAKEDRADFIRVVAFGKTAEFVERYLKKGSKIGIEGRWKHDSYEKEGQKVYTDEVIANRVEFLEKKDSSGAAADPFSAEPGFFSGQTPEPSDSAKSAPAGGVPEGFSALDDDDDLPF